MSENINRIMRALADPDAPWYGSDLVSWVDLLLREHELLGAQCDYLRERVKELEAISSEAAKAATQGGWER